jgi:hypothetical protein
MSSDGAIERHELKFLASEEQATALRAAILPFCAPDAHAPAAGYRIHSLYFDTPQRDFYRANQLKQLVRIKPRVRTYGPSACPWVWLEVKRKAGDRVAKQRLRIPAADWPGLIAAPRATLPREQVARDGFLHLHDLHGCEPVCHIGYDRQAYVSDIDANLRVTFDRHITAWAVDGATDLALDRPGSPIDDGWAMASPVTGSPVIIEIKCPARAPAWLALIVQAVRLERCGVSKYVLGVESCRLAATRSARG